MPTTHTTDDDLDPLETADQEEVEEDMAEPEEEPEPQGGSDDDLEEEVEKVSKPSEEKLSAKQKAHMIPRHLIEQDLRPEDLWDEGSI